MTHHRWISFLALVALVAGCAGPSATVSSSSTGEEGSALPTASTLPSPRDFAGTWHGSYWQLGEVYYDDDADCTLQIKEDATFDVHCTRSAVGTNNIARSSSWSGHVVIKGHEIVLDDDAGSWPSIVLRSRNGTLYGTTLDPLVGATIEVEFERESQPSASPSSK
jgi:hypothetical protein